MTSWIQRRAGGGQNVAHKGYTPVIMGALWEQGSKECWCRLKKNTVDTPRSLHQEHGALLWEPLWPLKPFIILWCFPSCLDGVPTPSWSPESTPCVLDLQGLWKQRHRGPPWRVKLCSLSMHPLNALTFFLSPKHDQSLSHLTHSLRLLNLTKLCTLWPLPLSDWEWPELCTFH